MANVLDRSAMEHAIHLVSQVKDVLGYTYIPHQLPCVFTCSLQNDKEYLRATSCHPRLERGSRFHYMVCKEVSRKGQLSSLISSLPEDHHGQENSVWGVALVCKGSILPLFPSFSVLLVLMNQQRFQKILQDS